MFFILHLLMAAGVEVELQKRNEHFRQQKPDKLGSRASALNAYARPSAPTQKIEGTKLVTGHNYLALNEATGLHFIMTPTSEKHAAIHVAGHTVEGDITTDYDQLFDKNFGSRTKIHDDRESKRNSNKRSVTYTEEGGEEDPKQRKSSDTRKYVISS
jgi:hypothetical protein